jgi:hypothetical protein
LFDIDLRATSDAYMEVWKAQVNQILQKLEELFTCMPK